jgi:hypothetical protein
VAVPIALQSAFIDEKRRFTRAGLSSTEKYPNDHPADLSSSRRATATKALQPLLADLNLALITILRDDEVLYRRENEVYSSRTKLEEKLPQRPRPIRESSSRRATATRLPKPSTFSLAVLDLSVLKA